MASHSTDDSSGTSYQSSLIPLSKGMSFFGFTVKLALMLQMDESQLLQTSPQPELNLLDFTFILGSLIKKPAKEMSVSQESYRLTLPETNGSPLKIGLPNRKGSYSNHLFSGAFDVSFREGITYNQPFHQQPTVTNS